MVTTVDKECGIEIFIFQSCIKNMAANTCRYGENICLTCPRNKEVLYCHCFLTSNQFFVGTQVTWLSFWVVTRSVLGWTPFQLHLVMFIQMRISQEGTYEWLASVFRVDLFSTYENIGINININMPDYHS